MQDFFRAVAIGLGVLMGTFNQGIEPPLEASIHRGDQGLQVTAVLGPSISPKMEEALTDGVSMALTFVASVDGKASASGVRVLSFQPLNRQWQVSRPGESPKLFATRGEAERAWGFWTAVVPGSPSAFTVSVQASLSFPDRPDWKADMVWKAPVITWQKTFNRISEIPF